MYEWAQISRDVALMSDAPNYDDLYRRGAIYVGDLAVEQPTNKTAKALGLTITPSLLLRADHVIE